MLGQSLPQLEVNQQSLDIVGVHLTLDEVRIEARRIRAIASHQPPIPLFILILLSIPVLGEYLQSHFAESAQNFDHA